LFLEPAPGEHADAALLRDGDRFEWRAERRGPTRLHLAEHEDGDAGLLPGAHEVELAFAAAPVAVDDDEAAGLVPTRHQRLARVAEATAGVGRQLRRPSRVPRC
jgi:hypothetical protein